MITIFHNPNCGTSRNTLALIRNSGVEPEVVLYLETPPSKDQLQKLISDMSMPVRDVLRQKDTPYEALDLGNPQWSDEELMDFMVAHPLLINRPIVVTPIGTKLCRPSEAVLDILENPQRGAFTKEDGEVVVNEGGLRVHGH
jgi:arsenate reductase